MNGKIPQEIVKDPSGLARELLWRVKRELGQGTDVEPEPVASNGTLPLAYGADTKSKMENGQKGRNGRTMKMKVSRSRISGFDVS